MPKVPNPQGRGRSAEGSGALRSRDKSERRRRREAKAAGRVVTKAAQDITRAGKRFKRDVERGPVARVLISAAREEEKRRSRQTARVQRDYRVKVAEARRLGLPKPPPPRLPITRETHARERARIAFDLAKRYPEKEDKLPGGLLGVLLGKPLEMKGGIAERTGRGLLNLGTVPAATLELGSAAGADLRSQFEDTAKILRHPLREHEPTPSQTGPLLKGIGVGAVESIRHPLRDPVMTGLTIAPVGVVGKRAATRGRAKPAPGARRPPRVVRTVPPEQVVGSARLGGRPAKKKGEAEVAAEPLGPPVPPGLKVRESLSPARARRAAQEGLYREERAQRIAKAEAASEAAGGGVAGHRAARAQLRGELPKVQFTHLREGKLRQSELDELARQVQDHPGLRPYEKLHANQALLDAFFEGKTPQRSQIKHLQTVFGQETVAAIEQASRLRKTGRLVVEVANVPRSMMASADVSAPFRQNLAAGARHPVIFAKNFPPMFKALGSEKTHKAIMAEIEARPTYQLMEDAGVFFADMGRDLAKREEQTMYAGAAERIPLAGGVVRASNRAFTAFGNRMRADMFDRQLEIAKRAGVNIEDRRQLHGIARVVNNATGRGGLGGIESWAPALNAVFWSPRLAMSRINFLSPWWYADLTPFARRQAIRTMVHLGAAASTALGLGYLAGARVGTDPRSADFAKLRIGNTRADILGGFQQYVRVGSQLASGKVVSSTTGKTVTLEPGFGKLTRQDIVERFLSGKFSPTASYFNDMLKGEGFEGEPFNPADAAAKRMIPLVAQDAYNLYRETDSIPLALLGYTVAAFGIGTQTYGDKTPERVQQRHDEYGEKILEGAVKTGLLPKGSSLTPQLKSALAVRSARYVNRAKLGAEDTRSRFAADVKFLLERKAVNTQTGERITPAKAKRAIEWAQNEQSDHLVERELRHLSDWYFDALYGDALADARQKIIERGYDLPRLR